MRRMVTNAEIEKLGGTKLYKHAVTFNIGFSGDYEEVSAELITPSSESLAGKAPNVILVSGTIGYNYNYHPIFYINAYYVVFYDMDNREISEGEIENDKILTDTVTAL